MSQNLSKPIPTTPLSNLTPKYHEIFLSPSSHASSMLSYIFKTPSFPSTQTPKPTPKPTRQSSGGTFPAPAPQKRAWGSASLLCPRVYGRSSAFRIPGKKRYFFKWKTLKDSETQGNLGKHWPSFSSKTLGSEIELPESTKGDQLTQPIETRGARNSRPSAKVLCKSLPLASLANQITGVFFVNFSGFNMVYHLFTWYNIIEPKYFEGAQARAHLGSCQDQRSARAVGLVLLYSSTKREWLDSAYCRFDSLLYGSNVRLMGVCPSVSPIRAFPTRT